jgi:hypothetical protein
MLIPFDKIGHAEEFSLSNEHQRLLGKLKLSVYTNGFTKILEITDSESERWEQINFNEIN